MSRILAYVLPWPGHLYPLIPVMQELHRRGHASTVVTARKELSSVLAAGLEGREIAGEVLDCLTLPAGQSAARADDRAQFARLGMITANDLTRVASEAAPDFFLLDPLLWGAMTAAEASGLPWASAAFNSLFIPVLGPRACGPGLKPPSTLIGRMAYRLVAADIRRHSDRRHLATINSLRVGRGLFPLAHFEELTHRPPLTLAFTSEPFEYPRSDWHPSVRFVGPCSWESPSLSPAWLEELDDRPLILVCTSSARQADHHLVATALAALADSPYQVVATVPGGRMPPLIPGNARIETYIPHGELLPKAVCVICHGGLGLTQKALMHGVPVVAVPYGRDQFETARRVEVARVGVRVPPRQLTTARLKGAVEQALRCGTSVQRISEALRNAGGAPAAADAIESVLRRGPSAHAAGDVAGVHSKV